jgi:hypothetical protein
MQPNHRGARRFFQDGHEELSQVKPWAPAPPLALLQSENLERKQGFGSRSQRSTFSAPSRLILSFCRGFGKPARAAASSAKANETAPYNLYRSRFLCRCAFMRLRRLCLAIFAFLRFLSEPIQILVTAIRLNHLIHCSASAVADLAIWFLVTARLLLSFCPACQCRFSSKMVGSIVCGPGIFRSTR